MKPELKNGNTLSVGSVLQQELEENISRGEQSILFINRRGTSGYVACGECGSALTCPNCSVSLTYHSSNGRMVCHYCGYSRRQPEACPECSGRLKYLSAGTQKVEQDVLSLFPDISVLRMDTDTVGPARSHQKILEEFRRRQVPVLVGTQMVTKGLDFPNVTLVGVISADQSLNSGSLRAQERTFSLITQVVGRSGRAEKPGRAVIQTLTPDNEVLRLAAVQDYDAFYEREISLRSVTGAPPFSELVSLSVTGAEESRVLQACVKLRDALEYSLKDTDCHILGPAPAGIVKVNNRYRYRVIIRGTADKCVRRTAANLLRHFAADSAWRGLTAAADYNPLD